MARLAIFCLPEEFQGWLRALAAQYDLAALAFHRDWDDGRLLALDDARLLDGGCYRLFMMPNADRPAEGLRMNDVRSRDDGWLDVEPGQLSRSGEAPYLLYSVVVGEDFEHEAVRPARFVRWLKRRVKRQALAGVVGWNTVTGGQSRYRDIWHTQAARDLFEAGVAWQQFAEGRVRYKPDPN